MYREPWFRILSVWEDRGRSMADIVADVSRETGVTIAEMRSERRDRRISRARRAAALRVMAERPDLSSQRIGAHIGVDGSSVRLLRRKVAAE